MEITLVNDGVVYITSSSVNKILWLMQRSSLIPVQVLYQPAQQRVHRVSQVFLLTLIQSQFIHKFTVKYKIRYNSRVGTPVPRTIYQNIYIYTNNMISHPKCQPL